MVRLLVLLRGACLLACVWGGASTAAAQDGGGFPVRISAGLKAGGGGNYLSEPDNVPLGPLVPLDDGAGGWGAAVGPYVQGAILDGLLALEIGFIYDWGYNWSEYTLNGTDFEIGWEFSALRIPLLFELGTPGDGTRLSFGTGPEFAIGMGSTGKVDPAAAVFNVVGSEPEDSSTYWCFNLGAEFPVQMLRVTFDVRYALNLDTESDYADRAGQARHDMDLRLLLGLAYDYTLDL